MSSGAPSPSPTAAAPPDAEPAVCANLLVPPCASPGFAASPAPAGCCCSDASAVCSLPEMCFVARSGCLAGLRLPVGILRYSKYTKATI